MQDSVRMKQTEIYNGPDFLEFCISTGKFLPANRDRTPCVTCPLSRICQAGFEEQVKRVLEGKDASLTADVVFSDEDLKTESILRGKTQAQAEFLVSKISSLRE